MKINIFHQYLKNFLAHQKILHKKNFLVQMQLVSGFLLCKQEQHIVSKMCSRNQNEESPPILQNVYLSTPMSNEILVSIIIIIESITLWRLFHGYLFYNKSLVTLYYMHQVSKFLYTNSRLAKKAFSAQDDTFFKTIQ